MKTSVLVKLAKVVKKYCNSDNWIWDHSNGHCCDIMCYEDPGFFNLTAEEVSEFATTSCGCDLWCFRALCWRLGISPRKADFVWYRCAK